MTALPDSLADELASMRRRIDSRKARKRFLRKLADERAMLKEQSPPFQYVNLPDHESID